MTPTDFLTTLIDPGLAFMRTVTGDRITTDDRSRVLLLAIAGQESNWTERVQSGNGPAHGFWQCERLGGVAGVLNDDATESYARRLCVGCQVKPTSLDVWSAFATPAGDKLAAAWARLLLWTAAAALPAAGDEDGAWLYYTRVWRPGKPSRTRWLSVYPQALAAVEDAKLSPKEPA